MSLITNLQNAERTQLTSKADVNINVGNGHSNINVTGKNVSIDTGCGDQDIQVKATGNLDIDTGFCGEDNIVALVGGDANITTREDNDTVNMVVNGNFNVDVGMVHPECGAEDDDDKVTIVSNATEGQSYLATGQGNDTVHLIANNVDVKKNDGSLNMGFIGNNYDINSDATYNMIAGWGDNVTMNLKLDGRANNNVYTFDQLWSDSNPEINSKFTTGFWQTDNSLVTSLTLGDGQEINFQNVMENVIQSYEKTETSTDVKSEVIDSKTDVTYETTIDISGDAGLSKAEIANKYKLSDKEKAALEKADLSAKYDDGTPKYVIVKRNNGKGENQVCEITNKKTDKNGTVRYDLKRVSTGEKLNNRVLNDKIDDSVTGSATQTTTTKERTTTTDTIRTTTTTTEEDVKYRVFDGVKDWQVNMGNGKVVGHITARDGYVNINHGNACNNEQVRDLIVDSGYITREVLDTRKSSSYVDTKKVTSEITDVKTSQQQIINAYSLWHGNVVSPLILDTNGDGKVSATAGQGIDLNNDGKADGAATGGDKMLAMTDLNGNGKIDGAEVFGDKTVSPFSGKAINAANGFEALKQIAQEAKAYTGIDCMNGSKVDVQKLQKALAKVGVNFGFISDDNISNIESLSGVKEIEVGKYTGQSYDASASVQNRIGGSYTDENGVEYKVDDVWFEI